MFIEADERRTREALKIFTSKDNNPAFLPTTCATRDDWAKI